MNHKYLTETKASEHTIQHKKVTGRWILTMRTLEYRAKASSLSVTKLFAGRLEAMVVGYDRRGRIITKRLIITHLVTVDLHEKIADLDTALPFSFRPMPIAMCSVFCAEFQTLRWRQNLHHLLHCSRADSTSLSMQSSRDHQRSRSRSNLSDSRSFFVTFHLQSTAAKNCTRCLFTLTLIEGMRRQLQCLVII